MSSLALDKAAQVKLAVFDVDGVLTDGRLTYISEGEASKTFHVQDGLGLQLLIQGGCEVAIISARTSDIVSRRMDDLGITRVYQGVVDKGAMLSEIMNELCLARSNIAYTGDDLVDLPAFRQAGLAIAVANAHALVKQRADWVTHRAGGEGAVREVCEMILTAQDALDPLLRQYLDE